ncbi:MAG: hypothetical protein IH908_12400 [Proteobacteria bacterium]|nr:hypothetical protein [Pseudomonadota bacterium]
MGFLEKLLDPAIIWAVIPVVAIIGVFGKQIVSRYFDHKERMAKIEAGMDPDRIEAGTDRDRIEED